MSFSKYQQHNKMHQGSACLFESTCLLAFRSFDQAPNTDSKNHIWLTHIRRQELLSICYPCTVWGEAVFQVAGAINHHCFVSASGPMVVAPGTKRLKKSRISIQFINKKDTLISSTWEFFPTVAFYLHIKCN